MGGPCRIVKDVDQTLLPMSQSILYTVKKFSGFTVPSIIPGQGEFGK